MGIRNAPCHWSPSDYDRSVPLPSGIVTFLFSDIEGSTKLARSMPAADWAAILEAHDDLVDGTVERHGGMVVKHEGDGTFAAFAATDDALAAATDLSRAVATRPWREGTTIRLRIGIHTGSPTLTRDGLDYMGVDVHYAARVAGAGNGGQVLVSEDARQAIIRGLPSDATLVSSGPQRLKDFDEPRPIHRLVVPGAADDDRPLRTIGGVDLPRMVTSFVGREVEVAAVSELLAQHRLVTLTGLGGTGKTRLSVGVAEAVAARFGDGVVFVELAPLRDPALVPAAVAAAVGVAENAGTTAADAVKAHLAEKTLLLVLDNLEQLLPAAAAFVGDLIRGGDGLRILISSREPLRIAGEQEYQVPPLGTGEAEALFLDRARLVRPDYTPNAEDAVAIAGIARRLEGLPLAIELAAARVKVFPPTRILERLSSALDLLTSSARDLPERQRTVRGAIAWSYDLLPADEQLLFRRLAVLVGDWTSESAEGIADAEGDLGLDTLDGLVSLVDKSLFRVVPTEHGDPLFGRHAFVREYAWEQLDASGERALCERRHGAVFRDLAVVAGAHLVEAGAETSLDILDHAIHDLRQAMTLVAHLGRGRAGSADHRLGLAVVADPSPAVGGP